MAGDDRIFLPCHRGLHILAHMIANRHLENGIHMKSNNVAQTNVKRKPGRPRAIPESLIPKVIHFYSEGLGYRAIVRELRGKKVCVDWSTVRRVIKDHDRQVDEEYNLDQL